MEIKLCEFQKKGHCQSYFNSLLKIKGTELKLKEKELFDRKKNIILRLKERIMLLRFFLEFEDKNKKKIIHILFGDTFFYIPIFRKLFNKNMKIIMTLHNVSQNKLKRYLVKNFSKKINLIIVHSEFLRNELNSLGINNVKVINYPSFYNYLECDKDKIKQKFQISKDKLVISLLGGTREDKGYDIFFKALDYLEDKYQKIILVNVSGFKIDFDNLELKQKIIEKPINNRIKIENIDDQEFLENVFITDIMVMPYLKSFGGNSGPMTEAIVNKIPCITPKELNIGKINLKNNLGEVFECENPRSLAKAIERTIENLDKGVYYNTDFYKELTEEKFLEGYKKIYEEVWSDLENE